MFSVSLHALMICYISLSCLWSRLWKKIWRRRMTIKRKCILIEHRHLLKNIFPIQFSLFNLPWKEICNHNRNLRWNIKDITSCWPRVLNGNSNLSNKYSSFCQKFLIEYICNIFYNEFFTELRKWITFLKYSSLWTKTM